jgi:hypothetical protein
VELGIVVYKGVVMDQNEYGVYRGVSSDRDLCVNEPFSAMCVVWCRIACSAL